MKLGQKIAVNYLRAKLNILSLVSKKRAAAEAFEPITAKVFPNDTSDWVKRNGAAETGIGLAMMLKPTRSLGVLGLLAYTGWLGYNAANAQT